MKIHEFDSDNDKGVKLAVIAFQDVRVGLDELKKETEKFRIYGIGTDESGKWRVYTLNSAKHVQGITLTTKEEDELTGINISNSSKKYFSNKTKQYFRSHRDELKKVIPVRGIVKLIFLAQNDSDYIKNEIINSLASFDTCHGETFYNNKQQSSIMGSRLMLLPEMNSIEGNSLSGFSILGQVRIPLHTPVDTDSKLFPRGIIKLVAMGGRGLWSEKTHKSALFDEISIGLTKGDFIGEYDDKPASKVLYNSISSSNLIDLTDAVDKFEYTLKPNHQEPRKYKLQVSPLINLISPSTTKKIRIDDINFGFRTIAVNETNTTKIALRYEERVLNDSVNENLKKHSSDITLNNFKFPKSWYPIYAIEQRLEDLFNKPLTEHLQRSDWVFTIQENNKALSASMKVNKIFTDSINKHYSGLKHVRSSSPLTYIPKLEFNTSKTNIWRIAGFVRDNYSQNILVNKKDELEEIEFKLISFEPSPIMDFWDKNSKVTCPVDVTYEHVILKDNSKLTYKGEIIAPRFTSTDRLADDIPACVLSPAFQPALSSLSYDSFDTINKSLKGTIFNLQLTGTSSKEFARHGSIQYKFKKTLTSPQELGPLDNNLYCRLFLRQYEDNDTKMEVAVSSLNNFLLEDIIPGGQDSISVDSDNTMSSSELPDPDSALIFNHQSSGQKENKKTQSYRLSVYEQITRNTIHELDARIYGFSMNESDRSNQSLPVPSQDVPSENPRDIYVFSPSPLRAAKVIFDGFQNLASNSSNEILVYNNKGEGGLSWRVVNDTQEIEYILPPQTIAEAMEKNRGNSKDKQKDINEGEIADARFGSLTRLVVDPTYFDTRYNEPGWNINRIFGVPNQRAPGAIVKDLRFEIVYGITTHIKPNGVSISEIGNYLGELPKALPDDHHISEYVNDYNKLLDIESRRLAVDNLWRERPEIGTTFTDEAKFQLRIREPNTENDVIKGPLTGFTWPVRGNKPDLEEDPLKDTFEIKNSFPGGIPWAFESANILLKVYRNPIADEGHVKNLKLSSLGGWADQRVLFDEKKTVIETQTSMGRIHRYALERIGRIGGSWNKAKHVIVYERTVVPSAQFYNDESIGKKQDQHKGRPIIRKVEEYIQIMEAERRYPENGKATEAAGFLVGCLFVSKKIRVDSDWGGDVRKEGWQVPLWNTAFANFEIDDNPDNPAAIYPKPQIRFLMAAEAGTTKSIEIAEPEKLVFYTSVIDGETGDNVDNWRPVRDIDFIDMPLPSVAKSNPTADDLIDANLPPEPDHIPGYERLTIGLVTSGETVALTHGRNDDGPVASLKNITLSRAKSLNESESIDINAYKIGNNLAKATSDLRAAKDKAAGQVNNLFVKITKQLLRYDFNVEAWKIEAKKEVTLLLGTGSDYGRFEDIIEAEKKKIHTLLAGPQVNLGAAADKLFQRVWQQINGQVDRLERFSQAAVEELVQQYKGVSLEFNGAIDEFHQGIDEDHYVERKAKLITKVDEYLNTVKGLTDKFPKGNMSNITNEFKAKIDEETSKLLNQIDGHLSDIISSLETSLAAGQLKAKEVEKILSETEQKVADKISKCTSPTLRKVLCFSLQSLRDAINILEKAESWTTGTRDKTISEIKTLSTNKTQKLKDRLILPSIFDEVAESTDLTIILLKNQCDNVLKEIKAVKKSLVDLPDVFPTKPILNNLLNDIRDKITNILKYPDQFVEDLVVKLRDESLKARSELNSKRNKIQTALNDTVSGIEDVFKDDSPQKIFDDYFNKYFSYKKTARVLRNTLNTKIDDIAGDLSNATKELDKTRREIEDKIHQQTEKLEVQARQYLGSLQQSVRDLVGEDPETLIQNGKRVFQQGSNTLRLLRAVGKPPKTDTLGVNRPQVAYILNETNKYIDMTPAISAVNKVADTLAAADQAQHAVADLFASFGIRLPTAQIGPQLLAGKLKNLPVSKLFSDFSGLSLEGLLPNIGFPDLDDNDAIKVRHGFDKKSLRAWLEADINVPFDKSLALLDKGPIKIIVDQASFRAEAKLSAGKGGQNKNVKGRISGDWRVVAAGQTILTFRKTGLFFDDSGKLDFRIQPDRVELAEALEFLTNIMKATGQKGGVEVGPFFRGSVPAGIAASLDMTLPPIQTGVFGITDLSFHALFGIAAIPEFELFTELSIAKKTSPFTLNIWLLNGGGYVSSRLSFLPTAKLDPVLNYQMEVGIVAGVGMNFNFGLVKGGVWLQVGCSITLLWSTGRGGSTTKITVFILARGNVDVAGLITASISLLLEVSYDGDVMLGAGTLTFKAKISFFYTLRVRQRVEYKFLGKRKETSQDSSYADDFA